MKFKGDITLKQVIVSIEICSLVAEIHQVSKK